LIKNFPNDLTESAISTSPVIKEILEELKNHNAKIVKMSGSGASCFAIFENSTKLSEAKKNLQKIFPNFFIQQARILSNVKN